MDRRKADFQYLNSTFSRGKCPLMAYS